MQYGICHLSIIPVKLQADDTSTLVTQLLYGDFFKVLERRKFWSKIRDGYDQSEGWISNHQYTEISEEEFEAGRSRDDAQFTSDLVSFVSSPQQSLTPVVLGSSLRFADLLDHTHEGNLSLEGMASKSNLIETALLYINAPYLKGGKTPFGIDSSGLAQMVYKINGIQLAREPEEQARQGEALSFIEESEPGDLAFFDNKEGVIDHVGIIMKDNYVIHAYGKVRIDRLDHTGIFNTEIRNYSHPLRVIKKLI